MSTLHVSLASGGAYAVLHASFWERLDATPGGKRMRNNITSMSGSSAGALVGAAVALGVPGRAVLQDLESGGLSGGMYSLRALAVYLGLKKSMYDGNNYLRRMERLCVNREHARVPIAVAVTSQLSMEQHCVQSDSDSALLNAAVASASIPYVLQAREVFPYGKCMDGGVLRDSFARDTVHSHLNKSSGTLVLVNCVPWPGYRDEPVRSKGRSMLRMVIGTSNELYDHGMERLLGYDVPYQDGIFDLRYNNRSGAPVPDKNGNLHVIFVAPTQAQYLSCGGAKTIGMLKYTRTNAVVAAMARTGRQMASEYLMRYVPLSL